MKALTGIVTALALTVSAAASTARPPLSQVAEIDDALMAVAIADDIRKRCDGIEARMFRAFLTIQSLEARARDLGYSEAEIEDYVTSKAEKARMRDKALNWLAARGVDGSDDAALCAYGRAAIAREDAVGRLLR
jgi:hypothetical protein